MVDVHVQDTVLTGIDRANREISVELVGWDQPADGGEIPLDVDASIGGRVESLTLESALAELRPIGGEFDRIDQSASTRRLDDEEYLLKVAQELISYIRFSGPADLVREGDDSLHLEFDHPTPVTVGFWSLLDYPEATVTVAPTPTGLARGIQALPSSHITEAAKRVMPGWRDHPPLIEVGSETDVPAAVAAAEPDTGIELVVPDRFEPLFPASSLAHYLGADVDVERRSAPLLRAPSVDLTHEFDPMPRFQHQAAATLRRVLYLDSIVKSARPGAANIVETALAERIGIDPEEYHERSPAERLQRYLAAPFEEVADEVPQRNYAVYVPADVQFGPVLPFVAKYMGHVYLPSALDGAGGRTPPKRRLEAIVGDRSSSRAYDLPPSVFSHGLEHLIEGDTNVDVVIVDNGSADRAASARAVYEERSAVVDGSVAVREDVDVAALATLFESRTDVVHFVGDGPGLSCPDGRLDAASLDETRSRIAVLDAPETTAESRALVENGGVLALGVGDRRPDVLPLETVLELLVQGFSVALGVDIVRETGADLADLHVVGDGTHNVFEDDSITRLPLFVRAHGDGEFEIRSEPNGPTPGITWHPDHPEIRSRLLEGARFTTTAGPMSAQLSEEGLMIVHDGNVYRSEDVDPFYPGI
jgi:hypothetical protein